MNGMKPTARGLRAALVATAGACLVTLIGLWPMTTEADDTTTAVAEDRGISPNSARAGSIDASSKLVLSEDGPSRWYFEVRFVNRRNDAPAVAAFTEQILESNVRSEMSRVAPMPRAMWSTTDRVALGPGETKTLRHELPAKVAARLTAKANARTASLKARGAPAGNRNAALASVNLVRTSLWGQLEAAQPGDTAPQPTKPALQVEPNVDLAGSVPLERAVFEPGVAGAPASAEVAAPREAQATSKRRSAKSEAILAPRPPFPKTSSKI